MYHQGTFGDTLRMTFPLFRIFPYSAYTKGSFEQDTTVVTRVIDENEGELRSEKVSQNDATS